MTESIHWTFSEKLQLLLDRRQKTGAQLAAYTGLARASILRWIEGTAAPRPNVLPKVAEFLDVSPESIDPLSADVRVPFIEQSPADGVTVLTLEGEECPPLWVSTRTGEVKVFSEHFSPVRISEQCRNAGKAELMQIVARRWLGDEVPETAELAALTVADNAMTPTCEPGSLLIYERTRDFSGPGVYVIEIDGKEAVRRVIRKPGEFQVSCDNERYPSYTDKSPKILGKALKIIRADEVK